MLLPPLRLFRVSNPTFYHLMANCQSLSSKLLPAQALYSFVFQIGYSGCSTSCTRDSEEYSKDPWDFHEFSQDAVICFHEFSCFLPRGRFLTVAWFWLQLRCLGLSRTRLQLSAHSAPPVIRGTESALRNSKRGTVLEESVNLCRHVQTVYRLSTACLQTVYLSMQNRQYQCDAICSWQCLIQIISDQIIHHFTPHYIK